MKKTFILMLSILFMLSSCISFYGGSDRPTAEASTSEKHESNGTPKESRKRKVTNYKEMKAIWVSQYDMSSVYTFGGVQRSREDYRQKVEKIIENIVSLNFNTVILQIRPFGDSFYKSDYYPVSSFVTGKYGRDLSYDAVGMFTEECHKAGLSVQAWINPMRLMRSTEIVNIENGPVKEMYENNELSEFEGRYYLDIGREKARRLIINGAKEALTKYDFDGLHMDDYFYPTEDDGFDCESFLSSGKNDRKQYRINSLNLLVSGLYKAVKQIDSRLIFGISPAGNISTFPGRYSADVFEWCGKAGYVDYIMPQIYFGMKHGTCPFDKTSQKWAEIIKNNSIELYLGMTLGKAKSGYEGKEDIYAVTSEGKREWIENRNVLAECFEAMRFIPKANGYALFCYSCFFDPITGEPNDDVKTEVEGILPYLKNEK